MSINVKVVGKHNDCVKSISAVSLKLKNGNIVKLFNNNKEAVNLRYDAKDKQAPNGFIMILKDDNDSLDVYEKFRFNNIDFIKESENDTSPILNIQRIEIYDDTHGKYMTKTRKRFSPSIIAMKDKITLMQGFKNCR